MCGRFSDRFTWKELHGLYRAFIYPNAPESTWTPKYNIAPTTQIPTVRFIDGNRRVDLMRWGLVPSWSKEVGKFSTFNARAEGVMGKPSYRGAWKAGHRCIIPASSFFEWRKSDKQPFAIGLGNGGPINFAGLWDTAQIDGGNLLSCAIITTEANEIMAPIHDRMPVIIGDENLPQWLGEEDTSEEQVAALLQPFWAGRMKVWPVSREVGKVANQGISLIEPV